jgi:hypothetical protein
MLRRGVTLAAHPKTVIRGGVSMPRQTVTAIKIAWYSTCILAILNLLVFVVVALSIGGFAGSGKTVDGRYYVGSHGVYTEVSLTVFRYSQVHYYGIWITNILALLVGAAYRWERK